MKSVLLCIVILFALLYAVPEKSRIAEAQRFCNANSFNKQYGIFINMSLHSGRKRLYLYSFTEKRVILTALVSHGCCKAEWASDETKTTPQFSNVPESHCSSLGKYRIGKRGYSSWGININYKLHGLESSNSNAYRRVIVLHSWEDIPDEESYPAGTPEGWGCPSVSNSVMKKLDAVLQKQKQPVLLWIYK